MNLIPCDKRLRTARRSSPWAWLTILTLAFRLASAATVTATLDRAEISLGESAHLGIAVQGAAMVRAPQIPAVEGLTFRYAGQQMSFQMINGAMSGSATHSYEVVPQRAGEFQIPAIAVPVGNETYRTSPLQLRVGAAASAPPPPPHASGTAPAPTAVDAAPSAAASLQVVLPRREAYVGEALPAKVRLLLHPNLKVREVSVPALGGDAFTVAPVPRQPTQTTENVNGIPYNVLTWSTTISAVKSGEHPLDSRIQLAVLQPTRHRLRDVFGGDFFDNFFGNDFFGGFEAKTVSVASSPTSLKTLPLPEEGRPDTFSGAVGHFELRAEADPRQVAAGDPITLRFTLRGNGNLERLQAPRLADSAKWKTYPSNARPSPDGSEKDAAQRAFEQAVIPLDAAVQTVPPVSWSYFDPEARRYVTLTTPALPLKVLPPAHAATSSPAASHEAPPPPPTEEERALAEARSWARRAAGRLLLLGQKPAFWLALLVPLVSFSAGRRAWESIRRRRQDPLHLRRLAASRAVRRALAELDAAQQRGDSSLFFAAAGRALREQLAARFHLNSASLVLRDVEPHLNGRPELLGEIRRLFEAADAAAFAGVGTDAAALAEWKARLASCLQQISAH